MGNLPTSPLYFHCGVMQWSRSLTLPNNTDANVIETPGAWSGSEVWHQSQPPSPGGPIFNVWNFKVLSWALYLATTAAARENVCQTEWRWASQGLKPSLPALFLEIDLFIQTRDRYCNHIPLLLIPLGFIALIPKMEENAGAQTSLMINHIKGKFCFCCITTRLHW